MKNNNPQSQGGSQGFSQLPPAARDEMIKRSEIDLFNPKEVILKSFDYSEYVYFIYKGMIMSYVQNGEESTVKWVVRGNGNFAFAWKMDSDIFSFQKQHTGQIMIALEETHVIKFSFENFKLLQDKWPVIGNVFSFHARGYLALDKWLQVKEHMKPKDKYEFLKRQVEFNIDNVPDVYLGSWLGITLEELKEVKNMV